MKSDVKTRSNSRRFAIAGGLGFGLALIIASIGWACTPVVGSTWYDDGQFAKSGASPNSLAVFATAAISNASYSLVAGNTVTPGHGGDACMDNVLILNPSTRFSNSRGFIAMTAGSINKPAGDWQICFRQLPNGQTATNPVFYTVI